MTAQVLSETKCELGEGVLWHPERMQVFWFDILGKRLHWKSFGAKSEQVHQFDEHVSAAGWIDTDTLLIASETGLWSFDIPTRQSSLLTPLEADNPVTRSNDGRADPWGGFWIGTMGKSAEPGAGAIYRFFKGEVRTLVRDVTISNAICFSPDHTSAYYTDTAIGKVMRTNLDDQGWPTGEPSCFLNFSDEDFGPDGAVVDSDGRFWNAQWGASRVACYSESGAMVDTIDLPTPQVSCPGFGGENLDQLIVTTASDGIAGDDQAGKTYCIPVTAKGQSEHQVIL